MRMWMNFVTFILSVISIRGTQKLSGQDDSVEISQAKYEPLDADIN